MHSNISPKLHFPENIWSIKIPVSYHLAGEKKAMASPKKIKKKAPPAFVSNVNKTYSNFGSTTHVTFGASQFSTIEIVFLKRNQQVTTYIIDGIENGKYNAHSPASDLFVPTCGHILLAFCKRMGHTEFLKQKACSLSACVVLDPGPCAITSRTRHIDRKESNCHQRVQTRELTMLKTKMLCHL